MFGVLHKAYKPTSLSKMPRSRRNLQAKHTAKAEDGEEALSSILRLLLPRVDDKTEMQRDLAAEYILEALRGKGMLISSASCEVFAQGGRLCELEELLAEALETVEVEFSAPQRAEAAQVLLDSGCLRVPLEQQRLRWEAEVAEEEAAEAAALLTLRVGTSGMRICVPYNPI